MKNLLSVFFIIPFLIFSQDEKPNERIVVDDFIQKYNSQDYEGIFSLFSDELKEEVPYEEISNSLRSLTANLGEVISTDFLEFRKPGMIEFTVLPVIRIGLNRNNFSSYKINFNKNELRLDISIDREDKIYNILLDEIIDETLEEKAINNLTDDKNIISEKQKELIFDASKHLPNEGQMSFAFIRNAKVNFFGLKRVNDSISSFENSKNVFEIGSISKVFTSNIFANFVLQEKVGIDDNINDYLDYDVKDNTLISFKSLANHTSGLPRLPNNLKASYSREKTNVYKKEDLDIYIKDSLEINSKTKGKFVYSNLAVGLMGYVLSKIENVSFDTLYNSYIFSKYNMDNTIIDSSKSNELLVKGLSNIGNELENMYLDALAPAGSVISSVEDLAKYGIAQFDNSNNDLELIRRETFKLNNRVSLGLGWFILKAKKNIWFNHDGNTGGYSSSMFVDVENKNGVIILTNVDTEYTSNLGLKLMKSLY
mgnify:FL=1